jgi:GT2 family glycosyltransferase
MMKGPNLSIIIVSFNTSGLLRRCLRSLSDYPPAEDYEIIVVDNGSTDDSREMVKENFPRVKMIANPANRGFAAGNNRAFKVAWGRYLLLLNSDTEVTPGAVDRLLQFLRENPRVGLAGGKLLNLDNTLQPSCRPYPSLRRIIFSYRSPLNIIFPNNLFTRSYLTPPGSYETIHRVDSVAAAFVLIRRAALEEVGLFDERFFMFLEDSDLCYRMKKSGWGVYYNPRSAVYHHWGGTSSKMPYRMVLEHNLSMWRFLLKHYRYGFIKKSLLAAGFSLNIIITWLLNLFPRRESKSKELPAQTG